VNWNTDRSPSGFTFVTVLVLCAVVLGPPVAGAAAVERAPAPTDPGDGLTASVAPEANGTATPEPGTTTTATPEAERGGTATPKAEPNGTATPGTPTARPGTPSPSPRTPTTGNGTFVVSGLETPESLRVGDRLEVTATVTNRASRNATGTLRYSFGGSTVASRTVTLGPGGSTTLEFDLPFSELEATLGSVRPGTYVHGVRNESGGGSARRLRVTPDVDLEVETFDAPLEVSHGEPYIVLATVRNPGNSSITRQVSYEFAGETVLDRAVTVAGDDDRQVAFEVDLSAVETVVGPVDSETTYDHGAVTGGHRKGGAVRVVRGSSANASALAVASFEATDDVRSGGSYRIELSVRNVDTAGFEGQLSYRVDGAVVATEWTRVPVGERRTVAFRVRYDDVVDATAPLSSQDTVHGVFVGEDAVVTRPVSVHAPVGTETPRPTPTFAATTPVESSTPTVAGPTTGTPTPTGGERCERGFFTRCGGTAMDETSLTLFGVFLSGLGIVYEMFGGRR
jgi:hypothetical protein